MAGLYELQGRRLWSDLKCGGRVGRQLSGNTRQRWADGNKWNPRGEFPRCLCLVSSIAALLLTQLVCMLVNSSSGDVRSTRACSSFTFSGGTSAGNRSSHYKYETDASVTGWHVRGHPEVNVLLAQSVSVIYLAATLTCVQRRPFFVADWDLQCVTRRRGVEHECSQEKTGWLAGYRMVWASLQSGRGGELRPSATLWGPARALLRSSFSSLEDDSKMKHSWTSRDKGCSAIGSLTVVCSGSVPKCTG